MAGGGLHHEGWLLTPEGAAVRPGCGTAVVADVHLGYEWARGSAGDSVPAHTLAETRASLGSLLGRSAIRRLVVAGDFVESHRPCARTAADVKRLGTWLDSRGVELVVVPGNHDRSLAAFPDPPKLASAVEVDGWTIQHGDRPLVGERAVIGHHHPVFRGGGAASARCFLAGPRLLVLPAFSGNAAGLDVVSAALPSSWSNAGMRCLVALGDGLLDFGPLDSLGARLLAPPPRAH